MSFAEEKAKFLGYQPNVGDLLREIYELLAFFLASKSIAELEGSSLYEPNDPIHSFCEIERDLITNRLITVAITIRILDDRHSAVFDLFTNYCGTINSDINELLYTQGMGLRVACNKIIHARRVEFDVAYTASGNKFLHPYIHLEGDERNKTWRADLDVVKFCRESAAAAAMFSR